MPKIQAVKIEVERAEGFTEECCKVTIEAGGPGRGDVWAGANAVLRGNSQTAPRTGGYDKHDFKITWADGEVYEGRYDLKHWSIETSDLAAHIRSFLGFYAGTKRPGHLTEAEYNRHLTLIEKREPGNRERALAYLAKYQIGTPDPTTQGRPSALPARAVASGPNA